MHYDRIPSPPLAEDEEIDLENERSWPIWPNADTLSTSTMIHKLEVALEENSFSTTPLATLPLSTAQLVRAVKRTPEELHIEAVAFAIMARNQSVLESLLNDSYQMDFESISPFHLAANYLNGSDTCCNILYTTSIDLGHMLRKLYVNRYQHTVLDTLMIAILKSHTTCPPAAVSDHFRFEKRFPGEEVDICGRWDADSPCIRNLLARGDAVIPREWKHMFCHTSAQTICHSISTIFGPYFAPDINTPSGLFVKRCTCGLILELRPLHCLILVAFHVARSRFQGETMFGVLACLVCLLVNGANPFDKSTLSINALLGINDEEGDCTHFELDPLQLVHQLPDIFMSDWTVEVKLGWQVFVRVLCLAQDERTASSLRRHSRDKRSTNHDDEMDCDRKTDHEDPPGKKMCDHQKSHGNFYCGSNEIASLWAAIQTEMLTYRRLAEGDPCISDNFDMQALLDGLENGSGVSFLPLIAREMMQPYCHCGRFKNAEDEACVLVDEASRDYFSNLEDWNRTTFIIMPYDRMYYWYKIFRGSYESFCSEAALSA